MSDNIINVKETIRSFIKNKLVSDFPLFFPTNNKKVYWEDTKPNDREDFPYCFLEIESETIDGYDDFNKYELRTISSVKHLYKIETEHNNIVVGFNICSSRDDTNVNNALKLNGLQSQNLAQKMIRTLRRKLRNDESLSWFSDGNNPYNFRIGIETQNISPIQYLPDWEETRDKHKFRFTCSFNWIDVYETEVDIAEAINIVEINNEDTDIVIDLI